MQDIVRTNQGVDDRFFRTRFLPMLEEKSLKTQTTSPEVIGAIGIIMDVSELKAKEMDLKEKVKEKRQLVANEAAAKEASRLKSQFLANVRVQPHSIMLLVLIREDVS